LDVVVPSAGSVEGVAVTTITFATALCVMVVGVVLLAAP
jgi:hypothetical protein